MKNYLIINKNAIDTNLELIEGFYIIDKDIHLDVEVNDNVDCLKLYFKDNVNASITKIFNVSSEEAFNFEYRVGANAIINEFVLVDKEDLNIKYNKKVNVEKNANYEASNGFFIDGNVHLDVNVDLLGERAQSLHNVASIANNDDKKEYFVKINNIGRHTHGELNNFGVVKDSATLTFEGVGYIKHGAIEAIAHQESKIITFDPGVKANANPLLIIDEAEVAEASHAAAVGKMDEEQLYYMQSRGIDFDSASQLITFGYLKPILNKIDNLELKEKLNNLIEEKVK